MNAKESTGENHSAAAQTTIEGAEVAFMAQGAAPAVSGRRSFFVFGDLGVAAASKGRLGALEISAIAAMESGTGWHYHVCESQLLHVIQGWSKLEFEDGTTRTIQAGDTLYIPGGFRHNEIKSSTDFKVIEVTVPADMGTVNCAPPQKKQPPQ